MAEPFVEGVLRNVAASRRALTMADCDRDLNSVLKLVVRQGCFVEKT